MTGSKLWLCVLAVLPGFVHGSGPELILPDQEYSASGMINLRDAPPKTIFYILGDKKGLVSNGERLTVKGVKEVNTITDKHYWLNVERENPDTKLKETGWVYGGKAGSESMWEAVK